MWRTVRGGGVSCWEVDSAGEQGAGSKYTRKAKRFWARGMGGARDPEPRPENNTLAQGANHNACWHGPGLDCPGSAHLSIHKLALACQLLACNHYQRTWVYQLSVHNYFLVTADLTLFYFSLSASLETTDAAQLLQRLQRLPTRAGPVGQLD